MFSTCKGVYNIAEKRLSVDDYIAIPKFRNATVIHAENITNSPQPF
jgi:hypothetical protein